MRGLLGTAATDVGVVRVDDAVDKELLGRDGDEGVADPDLTPISIIINISNKSTGVLIKQSLPSYTKEFLFRI